MARQLKRMCEMLSDANNPVQVDVYVADLLEWEATGADKLLVAGAVGVSVAQAGVPPDDLPQFQSKVGEMIDTFLAGPPCSPQAAISFASTLILNVVEGVRRGADGK